MFDEKYYIQAGGDILTYKYPVDTFLLGVEHRVSSFVRGVSQTPQVKEIIYFHKEKYKIFLSGAYYMPHETFNE